MKALDAEAVRDGYIEGASIFDLSQKFKRGKPAIRVCLESLRDSNGKLRRDTKEVEIVRLMKTGLSFSQVAVELNIGRERVKNIMRQRAIDKIRRRNAQSQAWTRVRAKANRVEFTLESMGLYDVGPCIDCHTILVSTRCNLKQTCGFCAIAPGGSRMFQRRAA